MTTFCGNTKSKIISEDKWINIDYTDTDALLSFLNSSERIKYIIYSANDLAYESVSKLKNSKNLKLKLTLIC